MAGWLRACRNAIVQLLPYVYVLVIMLAGPVVGFIYLPHAILKLIYVVDVGVFALVCLWVTSETIAASISRLWPVKQYTVKAWPTVVYIVPAYLNIEASVLDDTLEAYLKLTYQGSVTVLLVYNCKGDLHEVSMLLFCVLPRTKRRLILQIMC